MYQQLQPLENKNSTAKRGMPPAAFFKNRPEVYATLNKNPRREAGAPIRSSVGQTTTKTSAALDGEMGECGTGMFCTQNYL